MKPSFGSEATSMPVEANPFASPPDDPLERVWRYMDFAKFVSLLSIHKLYFSNLEILAKDDPHEGLLSAPNYRHREWRSIADLTPEEHKTIFYEPMDGEKKRIQFESYRNSKEYWLRRRFYDRRTLLVNCWHLNRYESAAMWTQYASGGQGIAITSNYARIVESLAAAQERVFVGRVAYLDWNSERVDNSSVLPFSKRASFAYENELRLAFWDLTAQEKINALCANLASHKFDHLYRRITGPINWSLIEAEVATVDYLPGIYVPVAIDALINEVYVSPTSPDWFLDLVSTVCEKYMLNRKPVRSDLMSSPIL
jgi:hypothetical protein